jgi:hypothetical protein
MKIGAAPYEGPSGSCCIPAKARPTSLPALRFSAGKWPLGEQRACGQTKRVSTTGRSSLAEPYGKARSIFSTANK